MWLLMVGLGVAATESGSEGAPEEPPLCRVGLGVGLEGGGLATSYRSFYGSGSISIVPVGSLRLLIADRVILEPDYRWIRSDSDAGFFEPEQGPDMATSYVGAFNAWSLGLTVKPLLGRREGKQLYPLVGAARTNFDYQEWRVDEDGRQQVEQVLLRRLQGTAGFGVQHWVTDDLTLSVDMQVLSVGKISQLDAEGVDDDDTTLNADGLSVDPSARLMLHLYW